MPGTMPALLTLLATLVVGAEASPMLIDDANFNVGQVAALAGTKGSCLADAHSGGYKTLPAETPKVGTKFWPQANGCYKFEEYHPGAANQDCAASLPDLVVKVEFCRGRSKDVLIPQRQGGGQWNTIGHFPLFTGEAAGIYAVGSRNRNCQDAAAGCFGAFDAFRVTKVSPQPCQMSLAVGEAPEVKVPKPGQPRPKEGVLTLGIDVGSSGLSQQDVLLQVRFQTVAIEEALAEALHLDRAKLTSLQLSPLRRLSGGLGIQAVSITVYFRAWGGAGGSIDSQGLQVALERTINARGGLGGGLSIASAAVFIDVRPREVGEDSSRGIEPWQVVVMTLSFLASCAIGILVAVVLRKRHLRRLEQRKQRSEAAIAKEKGIENPDPVADLEKSPANVEAKAEDNDSASTDTPKDDNAVQGTESNEGIEGNNLEV